MADRWRPNRRQILVGGGLAAGLVLAWGLWPRSYEANLAAREGETVLGAYLKIANDGRITVAVPQSEMGQGVFTVLPQILADELGADWRTVAVEPAPINPLYTNDVLAERWAETLLPAGADQGMDSSASQWLAGEVATRNAFIVTADSTALPAYGDQFRQAGAAARVLLTQVAADQWGVEWEACEVGNGLVSHGQKSETFGALAGRAAEFEVPDPVPLRAGTTHGVAGTDLPRLDVPAKLDGSANFAGDVRLPDMVFASIRQGPIGRTRLKSFNREAAGKIRGLIDVVDGGDWIAAAATDWWAANRALDAMSPVFETTGKLPDSEGMDQALADALESGEGVRFHSVGIIDGAFADSKTLRGEYQAAPAFHAALETPTATAQLMDGQLELWMATQAPVAAARAAAEAIGISPNRVVLHSMLAGGSFGRNLDSAVAAQVATLCKQLGRPVQLAHSRAEDMMHDRVRAPAHARYDAALDARGRVTALQIKVAAPPAAREMSKSLFEGQDAIAAMRTSLKEADRLALDGCVPPYDIPIFAIDHHPAYVAVPSGNWRSNAHSYNAFFRESFFDELAAEAETEPLSYRMQYMTDRPRMARCLAEVARMADWTGGVDNSGQGLACHQMHGGYIAMVASASRSDSGLQVRQISAKVDIGRIVNPDIARQQIEGGIIFGLAMAMGASIPFEKGLPSSTRLRSLSLPRMAETPRIRVEFIRSEEEPAGYEELGVPATAPAIANALHSATGVRFRRLPLFSDTL